MSRIIGDKHVGSRRVADVLICQLRHIDLFECIRRGDDYFYLMINFINENDPSYSAEIINRYLSKISFRTQF